MSSLSTRVHRKRRAEDPDPARRESLRRRRCTSATAGGAGFFYAALLAMTAGAEPNGLARWVSVTAVRLTHAARALAELGADLVHRLSGVHAATYWPLMALTLFWLGRQRQALYMRTALALLLLSLVGFAALAGSRLPAHEASLITHYTETPGVWAGWYVLMAMALVTAVSLVWVRAAALTAAVLVNTSVVLTADNWALSILLAGVLPLMAWYATAFFLPDRRSQKSKLPALPRRFDRRTA